jgi:TRAP transporter TAXI family solute receptor
MCLKLTRISALALLALGAATTAMPAQAQAENPAAALWNKLTEDTEVVDTRPAPASRAQQPAQTPYRRQIERANANTVSIVSGNPNGSYLSIAYDVAAVLDQPDGLRVLPVVGKGATQNLSDIMFLRGIDMGLIRSNTLSYYTGDREIAGLKDKIVYIAKLFNEEVHIYARPEIKSLKDLEGKRVNFSDAGSGSQFTTQQMFKAFGIKPVEVNMGQADGIEAMRRNEIAATVLEAGKPSKVFESLRSDDGFHFIGVDYIPALRESYFPAELTHEDYPRLIPEGRTVNTIATGAILAAYNWPADTERYRLLARFTDEFFTKFEEFRKAPRHPKWREVSLMAEHPGLKRFEPAVAWLDAHRPKPATPAAGAPKVEEEARTSTASSAEESGNKERERLFKEFAEWRSRAAAQ